MTHNIDLNKLENYVKQVIQENKEREEKRLIIEAILLKSRKKQVQKKILLYTIPTIVAASFVVWLMILPPKPEIDPNHYYNEHFQPEVNQVQYRGSDSSEVPQSPNSEIYATEAQLSKAKQAMIDENWEEASNIFIKLLEEGGSVKIESLWNLALINLKTEKYIECRKFLFQLLETKDPAYYKEAQTLQRRIK